MPSTLTLANKICIYLSTLLLYIGILMTLGMLSRMKDSLAIEFHLSESFLGLLDGISFVGGVTSSLAMSLLTKRKPVRKVFIFAILLILSMESHVLSKWAPGLHVPILMISRLFCGFFFQSYFTAFVIMSFYLENQNEKQALYQIWNGIGTVGDVLGIILSDYLMNTWKLDWAVSMSIGLIFLLASALFLFFAIPQIERDETNQDNLDYCSSLQQYWSLGLNILHSITYLITCIYYIMLLWLPYFFIRIGYPDKGAAISISFPLAYVISGIIFPFIQMKLKNHIGGLFMVALILNSILSLFLFQLGNDAEDIPKYFILIFTCSFLFCGFNIYIQSIDQYNRTRNNRQLMLIVSVNAGCTQILYIILTVVSGYLMEIDLYNIFRIYFVLAEISTLLHLFRLVKYPDSFSQQVNAEAEPLNEQREI